MTIVFCINMFSLQSQSTIVFSFITHFQNSPSDEVAKTIFGTGVKRGSLCSYILWWLVLDYAEWPHPVLLVVLVCPHLSLASLSQSICLTMVLSSCFCTESYNHQRVEQCLHLQSHLQFDWSLSWCPFHTSSFLIPDLFPFLLILLFTYPICFRQRKNKYSLTHSLNWSVSTLLMPTIAFWTFLVFQL